MATDLAMSGVFSGMDTTTLVAKLVQIEAAPLNRLRTQQAQLKQKDAAVADLEARMTSLQDLLGELRDSTSLRSVSASSSSTAVASVTASAGTSEGTHTLQVNRLASSQRQVHAGAAAATSLVGAGTFNYTYDGVTRNIVTNSETTLEQLRDLINNDASNPGVTASLLQYDSGDGLAFHLVLAGRHTGDDYSVTVNNAQTTLNGGNGTLDLRSTSFTVTQHARNAQVRIDGYPADDPMSEDDWIESKSNTVEGLVPGTTLSLSGMGTTNLTFTRNTAQLKSDLNNLVAIYNGLVDKLKTYTGYDSEAKSAGILQGDQGLRGLLLQTRQALTQAAGFSDGESYRLAAQVGLEFGSDGKMTLDAAKLDQALNSDYDKVLQVIGARNSGLSSDLSGYVQFTRAGDEVPAGLYDVEVTFSGGQISQARIRQADGEWQAAQVAGNVVYGLDGTDLEEFQVTANWDGVSETQTAQIRVKRGFAGEGYNRVQDLLEATTGRLPSIRTRFTSSLKLLEDKIEFQTARLEKFEAATKAKFARLERALAELEALNGQVQGMVKQLSGSSNSDS